MNSGILMMFAQTFLLVCLMYWIQLHILSAYVFTFTSVTIFSIRGGLEKGNWCKLNSTWNADWPLSTFLSLDFFLLNWDEADRCINTVTVHPTKKGGKVVTVINFHYQLWNRPSAKKMKWFFLPLVLYPSQNQFLFTGNHWRMTGTPFCMQRWYLLPHFFIHSILFSPILRIPLHFGKFIFFLASTYQNHITLCSLSSLMPMENSTGWDI